MTRQRKRRLARKGNAVKTLELRPEGPEYSVLTSNGETVTFKEPSWRTIIKTAADASPMNAQGQPIGFTPDLMRQRLRLHEIVDELPEKATEVELHPEDAKQLAAAVACMSWARPSQWILDFCDAVEALTK